MGYARLGRGAVVVLSSGWPLSNEGIASDDNFTVVLNALAYRDPNRKLAVTFDEYHHGYAAKQGVFALLGTPAKLGLAQMGVAFLLLVFATSRRFGRPVPLREGARPRSEYLGSMSSLLRKAHKSEIVRSELGRRFLNDAAAALGLAPGASADMILEAATRRRPDRVNDLMFLAHEAESPAAGREDDAYVLTLAKRWHKMRKELMKSR